MYIVIYEVVLFCRANALSVGQEIANTYFNQTFYPVYKNPPLVYVLKKTYFVKTIKILNSERIGNTTSRKLFTTSTYVGL
jgi:hypothetical protein